MKEATFYTKIHKRDTSCFLFIEKNIKELLGIDERLRKLKKGQRLYAKVTINLSDEGEN